MTEWEWPRIRVDEALGRFAGRELADLLLPAAIRARIEGDGAQSGDPQGMLLVGMAAAAFIYRVVRKPVRELIDPATGEVDRVWCGSSVWHAAILARRVRDALRGEGALVRAVHPDGDGDVE